MLRFLLPLVLWVVPMAGEGVPGRFSNTAELVYRLLHFIAQWPQKGMDPLVVGIAAADQSEVRRWEQLEARSVGGHRVGVRRVDSAAQMRHCHVLLIGRSATLPVHSILRQLTGSGVLTIAPIRGFSQMGGMVELIPAAQGRPFAL